MFFSIHSNNKGYKLNIHIARGIKHAGSQQKLADKLGYTQAFISLMLHELKPIPAEACRKLEFITDEESTAEQILPEVFEKITSL